jgi:hypothetical protein
MSAGFMFLIPRPFTALSVRVLNHFFDKTQTRINPTAAAILAPNPAQYSCQAFFTFKVYPSRLYPETTAHATRRPINSPRTAPHRSIPNLPPDVNGSLARAWVKLCPSTFPEIKSYPQSQRDLSGGLASLQLGHVFMLNANQKRKRQVAVKIQAKSSAIA